MQTRLDTIKTDALMSRRQFGFLLGGAVTSSVMQGVAADADSPELLRVIAYNIYAGKGWPDDRAGAKQAVSDGGIIQRLVDEIKRYEPDIISFSESPSMEVSVEIARLLGMHLARFPSGGNWPGTLLSRFQIMEVKNVPLGRDYEKDLFTRHWGSASLKLPNGERLLVHSAHLRPPPDTAIRLREISAMLESMKEDLEAGKSMLLIGDLNHRPDTEEYKLWQDAGWLDTFTEVGKGDGFTIKADKPHERIDYVMAAGPLAKNVVESRPLFEGAFRLSSDEQDAFALSDHLPQFASFKMPAAK